MIIESLQNASKYMGVHPLFEQAFAYINNTDLNQLEPGKYEVAEGLLAIISVAPGKTAEASLAKFECHNKNIDIQLCIKGHERIGWKPRQKCVTPNGEYSDEKDVQFFHDAPDMYFDLTDGQFAIFFPEDVHAPMIAINESTAPIRKLVMKVRIK